MTEKNKPEAQQDENQIIAERRAKLAKLREEGAAYPNDFTREDLAARLLESGSSLKEVADVLRHRSLNERAFGCYLGAIVNASRRRRWASKKH